MALKTESGTDSVHAALRHNPHLWGDDELRAIFVVRLNDLEKLVDRVRSTPASEVPQHVLITGNRGMGKSTLLRRISLQVAEEPELLAQWLPLTFPEEQYTLSNLAEFWRNVLDALADAMERNSFPADELATLDAHIQRLGTLPHSDAEAQALDLLQGWIATHKRGLLLLIDSTDLLLDALAQPDRSGGTSSKTVSAGATALWRLRNTLSHQTGLFWIGTSYQAVETDQQYQDAFHDFFSIHELRSLTLKEMRTALLALAERFGSGGLQGAAGREQMASLLDIKPERLKSLRLLSGGNPRTTVTLYELFATAGDERVQTDLTRLLDQMTPLYKARMEALSDQARKILAHIMEHYQPIDIQTLAQVSGLPSSTLSTQLRRLQADGIVETTQSAKGKQRAYLVGERLFNIWYLMRNGTRRVRQRLAWLVQFMQLWYSADERKQLAKDRSQRIGTGGLSHSSERDYSRALATSLEADSIERVILEWKLVRSIQDECARTQTSLTAVLGDIFDLDGEDRVFQGAAEYLALIEGLESKLRLCPHPQTAEEMQEWVTLVKQSFGVTISLKEEISINALYSTKENFEKIVSLLRDERTFFDETYTADVAQAIRISIGTGDFFPDFPDPELACKQLQFCFADAPNVYLTVLHLFSRHHKNEWVKKAFQQASLQHDGNQLITLSYAHFLHDGLNEYAEAERAFLSYLAITAPLSNNPSFWYAIGDDSIGNRKHLGLAIAAYKKSISLDPKTAQVWRKLADTLAMHALRFGEAEAAYEQAIAIDPNDTLTWINLARYYVQIDKFALASEAYRSSLDSSTQAPDDSAIAQSLQANLWLGNRDMAKQALALLTAQAANGNESCFDLLVEQCGDCFKIGRGEAFAALLEESDHAEFLKPLRLGLRAAISTDAGAALAGATPETEALAREFLARIKPKIALTKNGPAAE